MREALGDDEAEIAMRRNGRLDRDGTIGQRWRGPLNRWWNAASAARASTRCAAGWCLASACCLAGAARRCATARRPRLARRGRLRRRWRLLRDRPRAREYERAEHDADTRSAKPRSHHALLERDKYI